MKNYIVKVVSVNGETFYLTPHLECSENLNDNVLWSADKWDIDSINNIVKSDIEMCGYTYKIEEYYKESLKMTVKLKRGNEVKEIDIVIAPDFILVYNLIKEGYRVIEVGDEFHTYKEKWREGE